MFSMLVRNFLQFHIYIFLSTKTAKDRINCSRLWCKVDNYLFITFWWFLIKFRWDIHIWIYPAFVWGNLIQTWRGKLIRVSTHLSSLISSSWPQKLLTGLIQNYAGHQEHTLFGAASTSSSGAPSTSSPGAPPTSSSSTPSTCHPEHLPQPLPHI